MHTVLHRIEQSLAIVLVSVAVAGIVGIVYDASTFAQGDYRVRTMVPGVVEV